MKEKVAKEVEKNMKDANANRSQIKRASVAPGPVSAEKDEVDEIYKEEDPIEASIGIRKKAGNI